MSYRAVFVVVRGSNDEFTFARVAAEVTEEILLRESKFMGVLIGALTKWALETKEGRAAWEGSSEDFNVGDLHSHLPNPTLEKYLRDAGIPHLEVECSSDHSQCRRWVYDTILMDSGKLDEKKAAEKEA